MKTTDKKLVVLGTGVGGTSIVWRLYKTFSNITVIDKKHYFESIPSALRCMVSPDHFNQSGVTMKPVFDTHGIKFVGGSVIVKVDTKAQKVYYYEIPKDFKETSIDYSLLKDEDLQSIDYDYLVMALGSSYKNSVKSDLDDIDHSKRLEKYKKKYKEITSAKHVMIIGGGSVGIELMGEIATEPTVLKNGTKITLVHSKDKVLERVTPKAHDYVMKFAKKYPNVNFVLGDRVDLKGLEVEEGKEFTVTTEKGTKIDNVDLLFECVGVYPNTEFAKNSEGLKDSINTSGSIAVDDYLRVKNTSNIFAIGDMNDFPEEKQAFTTKKQAKTVADNLIRLVKSKKSTPEDEMKKHKKNDIMMNISLGVKDAIMVNEKSKMASGSMAAKAKGFFGKYAGVIPATKPKAVIKIL